ncbi:MAG TPA: hypothetical protein PKA83_19230 [Pirellulaceae bacterium]|nr:hypothetical protein [Pirellulaceae bacterium]
MFFTQVHKLARRLATGIVLASAGAASIGYAQTTAVWNGGTGIWSTSGNWNPGVIPNGALYDVYVDNGNGIGSVVTMNQDVTMGRLTIDAGDTLNFGPSRWLTMAAGSFAGDGTITLNGSMALNNGQIRFSGNSQNYTLAGGGTLSLDGGYLYSIGSNNSLTSSVSITGSGYISTGNFVNQGSITAQGASGISIAPTSTFDNQGTLTAAAGSNITFGAGTYLNAGQTMKADGANSMLNFNAAAVVRGGTLAGINGGKIRLINSYSVFDGLTDGALTLEGNTEIYTGGFTPQFKGTISNNGTITVGSSSHFRVGTADGESATLNGTGNVVLDNAAIYSAFNNTTFNNHNNISGTGQIGSSGMDVVNHAAITASGGPLSLQPGQNGFTNLGTIKADANSTVHFGAGTYHNAGHSMTADGANSMLNFNAAAVVRGGTLAGINGGKIRLINSYMVLDGLTDGALTLEGNTEIYHGGFTPHFKGTISNNGTINVGSGSHLRVGTANGESVTLGGTGTLELNGALISSINSGTTFAQNYGHTIRGPGWISSNIDKVTNSGTISTASGTLAIMPGNEFKNEWLGFVHAETGGTINISSPVVINHGQFSVDQSSSINLTGGAVLSNYSAGTLTNGTYSVSGNGQLNLGIGNITNLYALVALSGSNANFAPVNSVTNIGSNGMLRIGDGKTFTTAGSLHLVYGAVRIENGGEFNVNGTLNNQGSIEVYAGGTFNATAGPLLQYDGQSKSLTDGTYIIGGTFKYSDGDVHRIGGGSLHLLGPNYQFLKGDNSSAIAGLGSVASSGIFGVSGGAVFSGPSSFTNEGNVYLGSANSTGTISVPGSYKQLGTYSATILQNGSLITGGNIEIEGGSLAGYGILQPGGTMPTVLIDELVSPAHWNDAGELRIDGRLGLSTGAIYQWRPDIMSSGILDNSNGVAGVDWGLISVRDGVFGGSVDLSFGFSYNPNNPFWLSNHEWDILTADNGGISASFNLVDSNFAHGYFSLGQVTSGNSTTLRLFYNAQAIPEPASASVLALGFSVVLYRRRRRETKGSGLILFGFGIEMDAGPTSRTQ